MTSKTIESEYLLANLMDNMPDAIYFKDRQSRFIMVSQNCAKKHGWNSPDEIVGETDFDLFSKAHAEQAFADEQQILRTGKPLSGIEEKETWPDGSVTWASTSKMPLKNEAGETIGTFGISRNITEHKEAELRVQRYAEEMRLIKEEIEDDLQMAGELQKTFFPASYPAFPEGAAPGECRVEFLHVFQACGEIGGDYCSIHRISETEAGIFLCDVQGIGVRSALVTALIRGIAQEIVPLGLDPGAYLARMNKLLLPLVCQEEIQLDITASYLVLDTATGEIRLASAGHPLPLLFRKGGEVNWLYENMALRGPMLARHPTATYPTIEALAGPGDGVVLFSDGLCSVGNAGGEAYGKQRLLDSARSLAGESLARVFQGLESGALAFAKTGSFADDVCLVGFQLRPS